MPNVNSLLDNNIVLKCECLDRIFLNGYLPNLQTANQLSWFLTQVRKQDIPRYSVLGEMTRSFVGEVDKLSKNENIPIIRFERKVRKEAQAKPFFNKAGNDDSIVMIGISQEKSNTFRPLSKKSREFGKYSVTRASSYVNHYYFYIQDKQFGPSFIKLCSYAPFSIRVWLNGHEWLKKQLQKENIAYCDLDNGILSCENEIRLQQIADSLSSDDIQAYFDRWIHKLPSPFTETDKRAGYGYNLSIMQLEVSKTEVFDRPIHGRQFFESVMKDNLDLGRPEKMQLIFNKRIPKYKNKQETFKTRIFSQDAIPSIHIEHRRTSVKQYFKCGKALRTETTINDARDFNVGKLLVNLDNLRTIGRNINNNLLEMEKTEHDCNISIEEFESMIQPTGDKNCRAPGLRFGDPRVAAIFAALCNFRLLISGVTNKELRQLVENHLGKVYTTRQMSYDLRRLTRKGILKRKEKTNK